LPVALDLPGLARLVTLADIPWFDGGPVTEADAHALDPERVAKRKEAEERNAALIARLLGGAPEGERQWRELAGHLVDFHRREAKPEWWAMFNRQDMSEEELIDDAECVGGLEADPDRPPFAEKKSVVYSFRFPAQDFKLRLGDSPRTADTLDSAGEIVRLNEDAFEISIKRRKNRDQLPPAFSLIPSGPIGDEILRAAIARYVGAVLKGNDDQ
jgi:hypothetical protein